MQAEITVLKTWDVMNLYKLESLTYAFQYAELIFNDYNLYKLLQAAHSVTTETSSSEMSKSSSCYNYYCSAY